MNDAHVDTHTSDKWFERKWITLKWIGKERKTEKNVRYMLNWLNIPRGY